MDVISWVIVAVILLISVTAFFVCAVVILDIRSSTNPKNSRTYELRISESGKATLVEKRNFRNH